MYSPLFAGVPGCAFILGAMHPRTEPIGMAFLYAWGELTLGDHLRANGMACHLIGKNPYES